MPLCLKPPSAKPSLIAAHVLVQTVPAWISRLTRRLMLMLPVKRPAAARGPDPPRRHRGLGYAPPRT